MNDWIIIKNEKSNYLAHHGIEKQKWGVRHGPPYPLDYEDHSKAQKKEISKYKFTSKKSQLPPKQRIKDTSKTKVSNNTIERAKYKITRTLVKMGVKKVDASMQTYGAHPFLDFANDLKEKENISKGKSVFDALTRSIQMYSSYGSGDNAYSFEDEGDLWKGNYKEKLRQYYGDNEEDYKDYIDDFRIKANKVDLTIPDSNIHHDDIDDSDLRKVNGQYKGRNNCVACTLVTELYEKGFKGLSAGMSKFGNNDYIVEDCFDGAKIKTIKAGDDLDTWMKDEYGNGSSGYFSGSYGGINKKGSKVRSGGHALHWNITDDGDVNVQDGQINKKFNSFKDVFNFYNFDKELDCKVSRLDNCKPNIEKLMSNGFLGMDVDVAAGGRGIPAYKSYGGEIFKPYAGDTKAQEDTYEVARDLTKKELYDQYKKYKKETYWDDNW